MAEFTFDTSVLDEKDDEEEFKPLASTAAPSNVVDFQFDTSVLDDPRDDVKTREAVRTAPQIHLEDKKTADSLGVDVPSVAGDADYKAEARAREIKRALQNAPVTKQWLGSDNNINYAHTDVENLAGIEEAWGVLSNVGKGVGEAAFQSIGHLVETVGILAQDTANAVDQYVPGQIDYDFTGSGPMFSLRHKTSAERGAKSPLDIYAQDFKNVSFGYEEGTSWEDVKESPISQFIPFAIETGIVSMPDMVMAVANLPAFVTRMVGSIGEERASNEGRPGDIRTSDLLKSLPAAVASALFERWTARGLFGLTDDLVGTGAKAVTKAGGKAFVTETVAEGVQEGLESFGGQVGTKKGVDWAEVGESSLQGMVAGGPFGAAVRTATASIQSGQRVSFAKKRTNAIKEMNNRDVPLRDSAPELYAEAQGQYMRKNGINDVEIDAEGVKILFQDGPDSDLVGSDEMQEALQTGAAATITPEEYWALPKETIDKISPSTIFSAGEMSDQDLSEVDDLVQEFGSLSEQEVEAEAATIDPEDVIYRDVYDQLIKAGATDTDAGPKAAQMAAVFNIFGQRSGIDPIKVAERFMPSIRKQLPEFYNTYAPDQQDYFIDRAKRASGKTDQKALGQSLLEFIAKRGGIIDQGGDLNADDFAAWQKANPFIGKLLRDMPEDVGADMFDGKIPDNINDLMPDYVREAAVEAGFLDEGADINALLEAVAEELSGNPVYSIANQDADALAEAEAVADLLEYMERNDIDLGQDTRAIKEQLEALGKDEEAAGRTLDQPGTPAFDAWFGDSKVVDADGNPLVVYHGTDQDFESFTEQEDGKRGFYFAPDSDVADVYRGKNNGWTEGSILPVYLSIQNPFVIKDFSKWEKFKARASGKKLRPSTKDGSLTSYISDEQFDKLQADGHDGILNEKTGEIIAFSPTQIKSVNNRGTYDPNDERILYQLTEAEIAEAEKLADRLNLNFKDVIRRVPHLVDGVKKMVAGEITRDEWNAIIDQYKPVTPFENVPKPETLAAMTDALDSSQEAKINAKVPKGQLVGLRLDIPAYKRADTWVATIHEAKPGGSSFAAGTPLSYRSTAAIVSPEGGRVTFGVVEKGAEKFATEQENSKGEKFNKATFATMRGEFVERSPAENKKIADAALNDPAWVQVGMDPERHTFFYNRSDHTRPILSADEVVQVGPLVFAKNVEYGKASTTLFQSAPATDGISVEKQTVNGTDFWVDATDADKQLMRRTSWRTAVSTITSGGKEYSFLKEDLQIGRKGRADLFKAAGIEADAEIVEEDTAGRRSFFQEAKPTKIEEGDVDLVATGQPVSFNFAHNTQSATAVFGKPEEGDQFGRDFEPSGRYVTMISEESAKREPSEGMVHGTLTLNNPLVVDNDSSNWKKTLSDQYDGKTGKELSKALIADGYDGVITKESNKYISEVVDFTTFKEARALYQGADNGLFVSHNLSVENLEHAIGLGGLAAPSLAVSNIDVDGVFDNFGEVTLLADPSLLDDKKAKTYDADIYTPRHPRAVYDVDYSSWSELNAEVKQSLDSLDLSLPDSSELDDAGAEAFIRSEALLYHYLKEQGKAPKVKKEKVLPWVKKASQLEFGGQFFLAKDPAFIKLAKASIEEDIKKIKENSPENYDHFLESWLPDGVPSEKRLEDMAFKVVGYKKRGGIDVNSMRSDLQKKLRQKKTSVAFKKYAADKFNDINKGDRIFKGFSPSGNSKYVPYNLDNVVKVMTRELQGGENFNYGAGSVRSRYATELKTRRQIQNNRDKIVSSSDMDAIREQSNDKLAQALEGLKSYYKFDSDGFGYYNDASSAISEGARGIREAFDLDADGQAIVDDLVSFLRDLPTEYFESKIQRAVGVSEFDTAIVPSGTSKALKDILKSSGLKVKTYKDGDSESRKESIKSAATLFQNQKDEARGSITFDENLDDIVINLFKAENLSTFLHESGHLYLEMMGELSQMPSANQSLRDDYQAIRDWLGVAPGEAFTTEHHEKWAETYEAYLKEGNAPSVHLMSAFAKFSSWLTVIYDKLKQGKLGRADLNDEVRGVMDRMMASEQQIAQARGFASMEPMFADADAAGVTPEQYERYILEKERSEASQVAELTARTLQDVERENNKWWKAESKRLAAEIEADLDTDATWVALFAIRRGTLPSGGVLPPYLPDSDKISKKALAELIDENAFRYLPKGMTVAKGGMHPDRLAGSYGFESGGQMIEAFQAMPKNEKGGFHTPKTFAKAEAQKRMLEEHGDIMNDGTMHEEALFRVHSENQSKLIAKELKWLVIKEAGKSNRETGKSQSVSSKMAKAAAKRIIAGKKVGQTLSPNKFLNAEMKAAKQAMAATLKGDFTAAKEAKQRQLLNFHLYREARKTGDKATKMRDYLAGLQRKVINPKNVHPDFISQVKSALSNVSFGKKAGPKRVAKLKSDFTAKAADEMGKKYGADLSLSKELDRALSNDNYQDMTFSELEGLHDSVKSMMKAGKDFSEAAVAEKRAILAEMKAGIEDKIDSIEKGSRDPNEASAIMTWGKEVIANHRQIYSVLLELDGYENNGPMVTNIFNRVKHANDAYLDRSMTAAKGINKILGVYSVKERAQILGSPLPGKLGKKIGAKVAGATGISVFNGSKVYVPEIKDSLSLASRLSFALNMGNKDNADAVLQEFGQPGVDAVLKTLTDKDWDVVEALWAHVDSYWHDTKDANGNVVAEGISTVEARVTGVVPKKIEAVPFVTPSGRTVTGGYYPLVADRVNSLSGTGQQDMDARDGLDGLIGGAHSKATTKHGSTIERTGGFYGSGRRVSLDLSVVFNHVDGVIKDIEMREAVVETHGLIKGISQAVQDAKGIEVSQQLEIWLKDTIGTKKPLEPFEKFISYARTGASIAEMGLSIRTMLQQPMGITQTIALIGEKYSAIGTWQFMSSKKDSIDFVFNKSKFMKNRGATFNRDVKDARNMLGMSHLSDTAVKWSFMGIQMLDMAVSLPSWLGGYQKALDEGMTEQEAVDFADSVVARGQGSGLDIHLSQNQRGNVYKKMFTMFYTFFNSYYNVQTDMWKQTKFTNMDSLGRYVMNQVWVTLLPSLLIDAMFNGGPGDDEEIWEWGGKTIVGFGFGGVLGVRDAVNSLISGYDYQLTPASGVVGKTIDAVVQAQQGEWDVQLAKALLMAIGYLGHVPGMRTATRFTDVAVNDGFEPDELEFWWRAFVMGKER